jgi:DNA-binding transcriptional MerR regulator
VTVPTEFTIGEAAAIVGVQPHTLRAWERRYAIVLPRRSRSNQRRYTIDDIRLLSAVKEAIGGHSHSVRRVAEQVSRTQGGAPSATATQAARATPSPDDSVWRTAMDLVPVLVLFLDRHGQIVDTNAAAAVDLDIARDQLRGRSFADLIVPAQRRRAAEVYRQPLRQRRDWQLEVDVDPAPALYTFDCWPVRTVTRRELLVLVGHQARVAHAAGSRAQPGG